MSVATVLFHLIPKWVHNRIVLSGYALTALLPVSAKKADAHFQDNVTNLTQILAKSATGFLENQAELSDVRFGNASDLSKSGCGAIALFNAMKALGETADAQTAADIIRGMERKGAALKGRAGISPLAVLRYLRRNGYPVKNFFAKDARLASEQAERFDTFIVSCYNNARNMGDRLHTVNIERTQEGFVVHNGYRYDRVSHRYTQSKAYPTLAEAITHIDPTYRSQPLLIIGIGQKKSTRRETC